MLSYLVLPSNPMTIFIPILQMKKQNSSKVK